MIFRGNEVPHTGFHSIIRRIEDPGAKIQKAKPGVNYLVKEYGPKAHGFEPEHASAIIGHMQAFARVAKEIGVPVAEAHSYHIQPNGHPGKVNVVEIVEEVGPDLRTLISDASRTTQDEALGLIDGYLAMHQKVWEAGFPISLDPPMANFCLTREGITYIDLMPPRRKISEDKVISEWPTPPDESRSFIEGRYFSPKQAQVIYLQVLRVATPRGIDPATIKGIIGERLGQLALEAIDYTDYKKDAVLASPRPEHADALRIIAAEELFERKINQQQFNQVYELTHIGNGGILPPLEQLLAASSILRAGVESIYQRRS